MLSIVRALPLVMFISMWSAAPAGADGSEAKAARDHDIAVGVGVSTSRSGGEEMFEPAGLLLLGGGLLAIGRWLRHRPSPEVKLG